MNSTNVKNSKLADDLVVLIPARNEEESLPRLLKEISKSISNHIIVVDNNSSDKTAEVAKKAGVIVISENKIGYGSACLAGIKYLSSLPKPFKYVCFFDGDGQSVVNDISKVSHPVLSKKVSYSQGSRMIYTQSILSITPMARVANRFFSKILTIIWKQNISDLGPLRIMTWNTLSSLNMFSKGYGWTMEMSAKVLKQRIPHFEVPVHYRQRTLGRSKISGNFKAALRAAFVMTLTFLYILLLWRPSTED